MSFWSQNVRQSRSSFNMLLSLAELFCHLYDSIFLNSYFLIIFISFLSISVYDSALYFGDDYYLLCYSSANINAQCYHSSDFSMN